MHKARYGERLGNVQALRVHHSSPVPTCSLTWKFSKTHPFGCLWRFHTWLIKSWPLVITPNLQTHSPSGFVNPLIPQLASLSTSLSFDHRGAIQTSAHLHSKDTFRLSLLRKFQWWLLSLQESGNSYLNVPFPRFLIHLFSLILVMKEEKRALLLCFQCRKQFSLRVNCPRLSRDVF